MPTCQCCGKVDPLGGILCRTCHHQYTQEFNEGRVPPPLKGLSRELLTYAFEPEDWAHICKMEYQMSREGKPDDEIRNAIYAYAEKCKEHGLRVRANIIKQIEAEAEKKRNIHTHRFY